MTSIPIWDTFSADKKNRLTVEETDMEINAVDQGITRYRELMKDLPPTAREPEISLIAQAMRSLSQAIERRQTELIQDPYRLARQAWAPVLLTTDTDKMALITLNALFTAASHNERNTVVNAAIAISDAIRLELYFDEIKLANKELYKRCQVHVKRWTAEQIEHIRKKAGIVTLTWSTQDKVRLGCELIKLCIDNCRLFYIDRAFKRMKTKDRIRLTKETEKILEERHEELEIIRPVFLPMVIPPLPWSDDFQDGGYRLLRTAGVHRRAGMHDSGQECPSVVRALNYIQERGWSINRTVLDLAQLVWNQGGSVCGIPSRLPEEIPPRPEGAYDSPRLKEWRAKATEIHNKNHEEAAIRTATMFKLTIAAKCKDYEVLWFPHFVDFRGRFYPQPTHLHPQGDDLCRGLLRFAKGCKVSAVGMERLKIHLANCYGEDKVSYAERVKFSDRLLCSLHGRKVADTDVWAGAEEPFSALAVMDEIQRLQCGDTDMSYVPVARDGTCNGLQHLCAMSRDEKGGALVNLVPADKPSGAYVFVKEAVEKAIDRDIEASTDKSDPCHAWKGHVTKTVVKQPTMTIPYGVTKIGMRNQIISNGCCKGLVGQPYQLARYMEGKISEVIRDTIEGAAEIMEWMRKAASVMARLGKPVSWSTPLGFRVNQNYTELRAVRVRTALSQVQLMLPTDERRICKRAQVRGLAPNHTHSYDAAHMQLTALQADKEDLQFYATHDAYKGLCEEQPRLDEITREEFVYLYENFDPLKMLRDDLIVQAGDEKLIPPLPPKGRLDIRGVLSSEYFFT